MLILLINVYGKQRKEPKAFLMLSLFRLDSTQKESAKIINAIVDDAKQHKFPHALVNAVLRKY